MNALDRFTEFRKRVVALRSGRERLQLCVLAVKARTQWQCRGALLLLHDPDFLAPDARIQDAAVLAVRRTLEGKRLAEVLRELLRGRFRARHLGIENDVVVGQGLPRLGGRLDLMPERYWNTDGTRPEAWPRSELECEWPTPFHETAGGYEALERIDRTFESFGHGTIAQVGVKLGLARDRTELRLDRPVFARVMAAVPARLIDVEQDQARSNVVVTVATGSTCTASEHVVRLQRTGPDLSMPHSEPVVSVGRSELLFPAPAERATTNVVLTFRGHSLQREEVSVRGRMQRSPRVGAIIAADGKDLIEEGLRASKNAGEFERAVSHVLSCLGLTAFWWGPPKVKLSMPNGGATADILALSPDDGMAVLVECTVENPGTEKITRLVGRTRKLGQLLGQEFGDAAPVVHAALAVVLPMEQIAETVRQACRTDGVDLWSGDELRSAFASLVIGVPEAEVRASLSTHLDSDHRGARRFSLV